MFNRLFASRKHPYVSGINRPDKIEIDLSGSKLSFLIPHHSNYHGFEGNASGSKLPPEKVNIYDRSRYKNYEEYLPEWRREGASFYNLMERRLEFYGPIWRGRPLGSMTFEASICRYDALPEEMSCLNPAHFEQIIMRRLWFLGPGQPSATRYKTPINWQLREISGVTCIYFERHRDYSSSKIEPEDFMHTYRDIGLWAPLDDSHYLIMRFGCLGYAPVDHCLTNMQRILDLTLGSVQLDLSENAQKSLTEIKHKWPNAQANQSHTPINWTYPEWRNGNPDKGEDSIVILKAGTPPPELIP